jgi:hypothetical protein
MSPDRTLPPDAEARALARSLLAADHAALSFLDAADALPAVSRIALARGPDGAPMTLVSALAPHHAGLAAHPACALMVAAPADRGDPLTHPRLMLRATAAFVATTPALRSHWLAQRPKSAAWIDLPDFAFVRFAVSAALLNAGFARAFRLTPADLAADAGP